MRLHPRFMDEGLFAAHLRRMRRTYQERHTLIVRGLSERFADHLELVPSTVGIHIAARAVTGKAEDMEEVVARAADRGVAVQPLADYGVDGPGPSGLLLGYGAIATDRIAEGRDRLRACLPA